MRISVDESVNAPRAEPELIIAMGASAGGFNALIEMLNSLPVLNTSIFVVLHLSPKANIEFLINHLQLSTPYQCRLAVNGEIIQTSCIYFAPPDYHMIIKGNTIKYGHGPDENGFRPSVDVLFRSAAVEYREKVLGIILSGLLDDGVTGMSIIRQCGGQCMVQDPSEAQFPDMPLNVIAKLKPDYILPVKSMGEIIIELSNKKKHPVKSIPDELIAEAAIAEKVHTSIDYTQSLGQHSNYTCPECGGSLWSIKDENVDRYRCFTGHSFTEEKLAELQKNEMETSLWVALRIMEERRKLLLKMSDKYEMKKINQFARSHRKKADELDMHIHNIKSVLFNLKEGQKD